MPRLWTISDIHLEDYVNGPALRRPTDFDVLVVAGDIREMDPIQAVRDVADLADGHPAVICFGNHDWWEVEVEPQARRAVALGRELDVAVLNDSSTTIAGLVFAGGTLWPDYLELIKQKPDHDAIIRGEQPPFMPASLMAMFEEPIFVRGKTMTRRATYLDIGQWHARTIDAIARAGADVVVTHYPPSLLDLAAAGDARLWVSGHVHAFSREMRGALELVVNPRQARAFADLMVIDVPSALEMVDKAASSPSR